MVLLDHQKLVGCKSLAQMLPFEQTLPVYNVVCVGAVCACVGGVIYCGHVIAQNCSREVPGTSCIQKHAGMTMARSKSGNRDFNRGLASPLVNILHFIYYLRGN